MTSSRSDSQVGATIDGIAQIQLLYVDAPTDPPVVPDPYSFLCSSKTETIQPRDGVITQWMDSQPEELPYNELAKLPLLE